jgi:hypothetical protein
MVNYLDLYAKPSNIVAVRLNKFVGLCRLVKQIFGWLKLVIGMVNQVNIIIFN